jgi:acetyltransferase-like isoleucine patch superfamily enzyme
MDTTAKVIRSAQTPRGGEGCFYLDMIVWLNGDRVEMGDRVGFNYGCYVNGYGGLEIGDRSIFGPYTMVHTANHEMDLGADPRMGLMAGASGADC